MSLHKSSMAEEARPKLIYLNQDTRQKQQIDMPFTSRTRGKVRRSTKSPQPGEALPAHSRNKLNSSSSAHATKASTDRNSRDETSRGNVIGGTSFAPRLNNITLNVRENTLASFRQQAPFSLPSSGSRIPIASTLSKPDSDMTTHNILRRKAPSVEQYVSGLNRSDSGPKNLADLRIDRTTKRISKSLPNDFRHSSTNSILDTASSEHIRPTMLPKKGSEELPPALIPELRALAAASNYHRTASSTPGVPTIGSPSTQYSGTTGPWSSRETTPTSISSCSPGIIQSTRTRTPSRLRKTVPSPNSTVENLRSRSKPPPTVDESSNLSAPKVTSKNDDESNLLLQENRKKQNRLARMPSAPAAPPRKSSVTSRSPKGEVKASAGLSDDSLSEHKTRLKYANDQLAETVPEAITPLDIPLPGDVPRRPSRKGIADLEMKSAPVVQSNLSPQSIRGYRRRDSLDVADLGHSNQGKVLAKGTDKEPRRDRVAYVENLGRPLHQEQSDAASSSSRLPGMTRTPDLPKREIAVKDDSGQGTREYGRSTIGKLSSRLGLFGRRSKVSREDVRPPESRDLRKGPAAGTGHEGYGRYARRGRKQSAGSGNSSRTRSTSTASGPSVGRKNSLSSAGGSDVEDFVAQRLQPVVITGGGNQTRPDSDAATIWPSFNRNSYGSESTFDLSKQLTNDPPASVASDSRSMSATSIATDTLSSIAMSSGPKPLSKALLGQLYPAHAPPSLDGYSTSQSSLIHDGFPGVSTGNKRAAHTLGDIQKASKSGRIFRWNLFRRKTSSTEENAKNIRERGREKTRMSVAVAPVAVDKPIPYYALMDSENENDGGDVLQDLFEQIYDSPTSFAETVSEPFGLGLRERYGQSVLLPTMPVLRQEYTHDAGSVTHDHLEGYENQPAEVVNQASPHSSGSKGQRLPQVGRIPRVISRRDRQHKPAVTSFSRPFQRDHANDAPQISFRHATSVSESKRPILGIHTDVLPSRPFASPESGQAASAPAAPLSTNPLGDFESYPGFLVFPGRGATHRSHAVEDEVWNEYDDLLDHVMSPTGPDPANSAGPSSGRLTREAVYPPLEPGRPDSHLPLRTLDVSRRTLHPGQPSLLRLPSLSPSRETAGVEYRLRRSRIVSALQSNASLSPSSPFPNNDQKLAFTDHPSANAGSSHRFSSAIFRDTSSPSPTAAGTGDNPAFPKLPEVSHYQSTALLDIAERDHEGPAGQSDLRFAALMTSRWLSFGRVLFSPAHTVIEASKDQHILVIDGLGNDDWSFYCAVTYPGAVIHDLKETDFLRGMRRDPPQDAWRAPPNYRRVELPNLAQRFPFPQSYFAAVVVRFPAAMSDAILKTAFAECKRVLVPGGYLELSLLDLDMVNMGSTTRHAVRDLKARMLGADPDVSLKPVSDNIQHMLGQRGFENLNRCVVGVPVAGKVATSSGSRSSRSSRESYSQKGKDAEQGSGLSSSRSRRSDDPYQKRGGNFSLSELVADHSATSDEKITRMVAKVGRWWYTRTYEWAVLPGGDLKKSIWSDKKMLHECKVRASGFKLLIAYAQKPVETRRRTLSEPIRSTAAVAGTRIMNRRDEMYRSEKKTR
jgi:hypothetical protein